MQLRCKNHIGEFLILNSASLYHLHHAEFVLFTFLLFFGTVAIVYIYITMKSPEKLKGSAMVKYQRILIFWFKGVEQYCTTLPL